MSSLIARLKWAERLTIIIAVVIVLLGTKRTLQAIRFLAGSNDPKISIGIDEGLILEGLEKKTSFLASFNWWREPWVGQVPFYRPITSQLFWLEQRLFGERYHWWLTVALICHLVAAGLGYWVLLRLLESRVLAAVAIALFASPEFNWHVGGVVVPQVNVWSTGFQHSLRTLTLWKNQPEYWVAIAIFATILLFMAKRYWLVLAGLFVAMTVKEVGLGLVPALMLINWYKQQKAPRWFWITGLAIAAALLTYRYAVLGTLGYSLGTNKAWWYRGLLYYLGGTLGGTAEGLLTGSENLDTANAVAGVGTGLAVLCLLAAIRCLMQGQIPKSFLAATAILTASWLAATWLAQGSIEQMKGGEPVSFVEAFVTLALLDGNWSLVIISIDVALIGFALLHLRREAALCFGLMFCFSAGLFFAAQVTQHAFYLADLFGRTLLVLGLAALVRAITPHAPYPREGFCLGGEGNFPILCYHKKMVRTTLTRLVLVSILLAAASLIAELLARQVLASHRTDYLRQDSITGGGIRSNGQYNDICVSGNLTSSYAVGNKVEIQPNPDDYYDIQDSSYHSEAFEDCYANSTIIGTQWPTGFDIGNAWVRVYSSDTTPPTISSLTAGSITQTGATISWTTNESATHTVKYGTSSGSYDSYPNSKAAGSNTTSASASL